AAVEDAGGWRPIERLATLLARAHAAEERERLRPKAAPAGVATSGGGSVDTGFAGSQDVRYCANEHLSLLRDVAGLRQWLEDPTQWHWADGAEVVLKKLEEMIARHGAAGLGLSAQEMRLMLQEAAAQAAFPGLGPADQPN
ncbi:unnamed protein product, partial [Phaeothamnion confervicola]